MLSLIIDNNDSISILICNSEQRNGHIHQFLFIFIISQVKSTLIAWIMTPNVVIESLNMRVVRKYHLFFLTTRISKYDQLT